MRIAIIGLVAAFALGACDSESNAGEDRLLSADELAESAVVVGVWVPNPESGNTYFLASRKLPEEISDLGDAKELPDGLAWHNDRAVFFGNFESGEIERYQVTKDYDVVRTGRLSLAKYGIAYPNSSPLFVADDRAYYLALDLGIAIVWNPETMKIVDEFDVSELARDGFKARPGTPHRDGDKLFVPIRYETDEGTTTGDDTVVAVFDLEDEGLTILEDTRASGAWSGFTSESGDYYTLADGGGGAIALTGLQELESPAMLRIKQGSDQLDPDYLFDIGKTLGTTGVYGLLPVSDTAFLVQAWPRDRDPASVTTPDEYWEVEDFEWQLLDAATQTAKRVEGVENGIPTVVIPLNVDGRGFLQQELPDGEGIGLYEVDRETAKATLALSAPAPFWFLGRIQGE